MRPIKFVTILLTTLVAFHNTASAVEFEECAKFMNTDKHKYHQCVGYSFSEAVQKTQYQKARQWLSANRGEDKQIYTQLLAMLMCENETVKGNREFKGSKQEVIRLTDDLLKLGASFGSMPHNYTVTPLFCVSNRKDSVVLDHVLSRIKVSSDELNTSQYEGIYSEYVPLYRAILNNDLASAKVLVKHGASPDASAVGAETALKKALELRNINMANWLLDLNSSGRSVCVGQSMLDDALAIPTNVSGRNQIIARIQTLMKTSATNGCS